MRTVVSVLFSVAVFVVVLMNAATGFVSTTPGLQTTEIHDDGPPLPKSLDQFYPPVAEQPIYLLNMLGLDTTFSGIVADVMDNDLEGARNSFSDFRSHYVEVSKMIPEWKVYYPEEPVENLGAALSTGDRGKIMETFGKVGRICHECHLATMVQVQQKYHWGDFSVVSVIDPLTGEKTDYAHFKKFLSTNLAGISVNLKQGQTENARKQFFGFKERFQALKESCQHCHDGESRYYTDENVGDLMDRLGQTFQKENVDPEAVGSLIQGIGRESCSKCHLVHVPAAVARAKRR